MSRQQKRAFERARDKEMDVLKDWATHFLKEVAQASPKFKKSVYKRLCANWEDYAKNNNKRNEKVRLSGKMFQQYMERFYLLTGAKDAPAEWKKHRKELSQTLPGWRKFLLWVTDGKIVRVKK